MSKVYKINEDDLEELYGFLLGLMIHTDESALRSGIMMAFNMLKKAATVSPQEDEDE